MIDVFGFHIYLYGLIIGFSIVLAWEISRRAARKKGVDEKTIENAFYWTVGVGIVGARVYHVIDLWEYYSVQPEKIMYLWNGGLAIWGAITGGFVGLWISWRLSKRRFRFVELTDVGVLGLPLAQAVGRLGNWVNGELYGKNGEPLFVYESGLNIMLFALLTIYSTKKRRSGFITGIYLIGYGVIRILLENWREPEIIWRVGDIPVAVIFSALAISIGLFQVARKRS